MMYFYEKWGKLIHIEIGHLTIYKLLGKNDGEKNKTEN